MVASLDPWNKTRVTMITVRVVAISQDETLIRCSDYRKEKETEPNRPNRAEPINSATGRNRTRNRTEPDRATTRPKNAGRTASNRET